MFERDASAHAFGVTAVENLFIQEYLPAAKGDYVKVYLWGVYQSHQASEDYGVPAMAKDLSMSVSEVEGALRYWERRGLVSRISDNPPVYRFYAVWQRALSQNHTSAADESYVDFAESVYAAFGDRRKVRPSEIALAYEWVQDVQLPAEVVLMLINHLIAIRGVNFSFKLAEPFAVTMKDEGITTADEADAYLRHDQAVHEGVKAVLRQFGKRRLATEDELALYKKWVDEWHYKPDAIIQACSETTKGDPSFAYLDAILKGLMSRKATPGSRSATQVQQQMAQEKDELKQVYALFDKLGVRLTPEAAKRLYGELTVLLPHDVLLMAAEDCARAGGKVDTLQRMAESWKEKGLTNVTAVQEHLQRMLAANRQLFQLFEACGHTGRPTAADRTLYEKWCAQGMSAELMLFAAEQARAAQGSKIAYLDKVLAAWHEAGITDISQAKAQKPAPRKAAGGKMVSAQQYTQRQYSQEELLAVSDDLMQEARNARG